MLVCCSVVLLGLTPFPDRRQPIGVEHTVAYFKTNAGDFAAQVRALEMRINEIDEQDSITVVPAREALINSRLAFKRIEFFFNYFFPSLTIIYNAPAVIEVEEPFMESREPTGLQVIEALLYSTTPAAGKKALQQQVALLQEASADLNSLLYNLPVSDAQILESVRLDLISVLLLGTAGFDTPEMKTGITEANQSLKTFATVLEPYLEEKTTQADSVRYYLQKAIQLTGVSADFNGFDRLGLLMQAGLPLQRWLGQLIAALGLELNSTAYLNYKAADIFRSEAININDRLGVDSLLAALGRKLFFEKSLSGNLTRSCATCHQPEKYYTDGLPKSKTIDEKGFVKRNAPTLLYAAFQHSQFWDGRVKSLEQQVEEVLENPVEMNGRRDSIVQRLVSSREYQAAFRNAFRESTTDTLISMDRISTAIAAFLKTLAPFSSPFDQYINGDSRAMSSEQIRGYNLFMGKALCGTCHTAPLFNGLTPPLFDLTAMEVIGTTKDTMFTRPRLDEDMGRFETYPIRFYMRAFKTPSLRNVAATAPYMHNGAFQDLASVVEFYNKGGGEGLGLTVPHQTLSAAPLRLDAGEVKSIVAFLQALTDQQVP